MINVSYEEKKNSFSKKEERKWGSCELEGNRENWEKEHVGGYRRVYPVEGDRQREYEEVRKGLQEKKKRIAKVEGVTLPVRPLARMLRQTSEEKRWAQVH